MESFAFPVVVWKSMAGGLLWSSFGEWGGSETEPERARESYFPSNDVPIFWWPNPEDERMLGELGQRVTH